MLRTAVAYGATGVALFFIVSSFSLLYASSQRKTEGARSLAMFYVRRVFRILPMLWVAMAFYLWRSGLGPRDWAPSGISIFDTFIVGIGMNGWHPFQINAVVPIGWTIGVEFAFYLVFPAMAFLIRSAPAALFAWFLAFVAANAWVRAVLPWALERFGTDAHTRELVTVFVGYMSLPAQLPVFMAGFVIFFLWKRAPAGTWLAQALLAISVALYASLIAGHMIAPMTIAHYTVMMMCFALSIILKPNVLFDNLVTRWIGKVSYSAYLIHMYVIYRLQDQGWALFAPPVGGDSLWMATFLLVLSITIAISSLTYTMIELPMMRLGSSIWRPRTMRVAPAGA